MNANKVFLIGNLTRDPDLRAMPNRTPIAMFGVATNQRYKRDGEVKTQTEFHSIVVYGKQAEDCARYLRKGALAHIDGRLHTRTWEKEGVKQSRTDIIADRVQFGPRQTSQAALGRDVPAEDDPNQRPPSERASESDIDDLGFNPDDIPF